MAYIITNAGEQKILLSGMKGGAAMTASLISSALTLTATMTYSSITNITAGGNGVASATVNLSAWCTPFLSAGSAAISASGNATNGGFLFSFTGTPNQSAVGYAIWDASNLFIVETFSDGPYWLSNAGDTVTVTPYVKLGSGSGN